MSFKLADGTTLQQNFVQDWTAIDRWVGGQTFGAGVNAQGQLGDGTATTKSSPIQVGSLTTWAQIANGCLSGATRALSAGVKTDGTLWAWGYNGDGGIGQANTGVNFSSPTQLGVLTNWKQVTCGYSWMAAVKTDGTAWGWGANAVGQLGLSDATSRSSPVQVGLLTNWKFITCGYQHTHAIKTDGTLWAWGENGSGKLGDGTTATKSSPVAVGSLQWSSVSTSGSHTAAVRSDGTLWTWGGNGSGQLGNGTITAVSSPIQVGLLTNWKYVGVGTGVTFGIKVDGTLWGIGSNTNGEIGQGSTVITLYSSPIQIGSLTNWKYVDAKKDVAAGTSVIAVRNDGTLWTWGINGSGQLGLGDIISRSSPVQVGSLTNWKQAAISSGNLVAISYGEDYLS